MNVTVRLAFSLFLTLAVNPAGAVDFRWIHDLTNDNNFHNPGNWSPGTTSWPDGTDDAAIFDVLATYSVDFDNNHPNERFEVRAGSPSIFLTTGSTPHLYSLHTTTEPAAVVSSFPGATDAPALTFHGITSATLGQSSITSFQDLQIAVGDHTTAGTLTLNGVSWASTAAALVGLNGNGELNMNPDARMTSAGGVLGSTGLSVGVANVLGAWAVTSGDLVVGKAVQGR